MLESKMSGKFAPLMRILMVIALVALAVFAAGCGDDDGDKTDKADKGDGNVASITAEKNADVAAMVPAKVRDRGTLRIAMDATYPPNEFFDEDGKTIIGMDPDLAKALGQVMGLEVELKNTTFDAILPGLAAGKYDIAMSSFTDTKEREKTVDMVTYLTAGTKFYTAAEGGTEVEGLDDLCGLTVAVEKGTTQAEDAQKQSKDCKSEGKKPVNVDVFTDQNAANLALTSGRADVGMADSPVAAYIVDKSNGQLKATGTDYGEAPYGIAVNKESGLTKAVQAAVKALMEGGQYSAVLEKWNLSDEAIDEPKINDGVE